MRLITALSLSAVAFAVAISATPASAATITQISYTVGSGSFGAFGGTNATGAILGGSVTVTLPGPSGVSTTPSWSCSGASGGCGTAAIVLTGLSGYVKATLPVSWAWVSSGFASFFHFSGLSHPMLSGASAPGGGGHRHRLVHIGSRRLRTRGDQPHLDQGRHLCLEGVSRAQLSDRARSTHDHPRALYGVPAGVGHGASGTGRRRPTTGHRGLEDASPLVGAIAEGVAGDIPVGSFSQLDGVRMTIRRTSVMSRVAQRIPSRPRPATWEENSPLPLISLREFADGALSEVVRTRL